MPEGEPAWVVLMDLKDIVELIVAPVHTDESIAYLKAKLLSTDRGTKSCSLVLGFCQSTTI